MYFPQLCSEHESINVTCLVYIDIKVDCMTNDENYTEINKGDKTELGLICLERDLKVTFASVGGCY